MVPTALHASQSWSMLKTEPNGSRPEENKQDEKSPWHRLSNKPTTTIQRQLSNPNEGLSYQSSQEPHLERAKIKVVHPLKGKKWVWGYFHHLNSQRGIQISPGLHCSQACASNTNLQYYGEASQKPHGSSWD